MRGPAYLYGEVVKWHPIQEAVASRNSRGIKAVRTLSGVALAANLAFTAFAAEKVVELASLSAKADQTGIAVENAAAATGAAAAGAITSLMSVEMALSIIVASRELKELEADV